METCSGGGPLYWVELVDDAVPEAVARYIPAPARITATITPAPMSALLTARRFAGREALIEPAALPMRGSEYGWMRLPNARPARTACRTKRTMKAESLSRYSWNAPWTTLPGLPSPM